MCWMALIPVAMSLVGGMAKGNAEEAAGDAASRDMRQNAMFANDAAVDALDRGAKNADKQRVQTGLAIGTQRAAQAANGGMVDQDSNAELVSDTAQIGELDALTISNNAAREAYGYKVQAIQGLANARNTKLQGQQKKQSSLLGGVMEGFGSMAGGIGGGGGGGGGGSGLAGTGVAGGQKGFRGGMTSGR